MTDILRVATYNIHACVGGDRRYDPDRVLSVLREIDADILALQEVGGRFVGDVEQVRYFEEALGMGMVYGPNLIRRKAQFGNALFVRGRVLRSDLVNLSVIRVEPRGAIDAVVEVKGHVVRVLATHLGLLRRERRAQIACLAERLAQVHHPLTLLLGDFNIFGWERAALTRIGAPPRLPRLRSFPARRPLVSLDRIWAIPNDRILETRLHRSRTSRTASDHLPLVAGLRLSGEAADSASLAVTMAERPAHLLSADSACPPSHSGTA